MRTNGGLVRVNSVPSPGKTTDTRVYEEILAAAELNDGLQAAGDSGLEIERQLLSRGIAREDILRCLSEAYRLPFIEFSESLMAPPQLLELVDFEELKEEAWCPLSCRGGTCRVAAFNPRKSLAERIKKTLEVDRVEFLIALPSDIVRILEHSFDVNPGFPRSAGRTPLAELRTWLAGERVKLAQFRTTLAKGRTGLALIRTGVSSVSIGLVLLRIFSIGYLSVLEGLLILCGLVMVIEGVQWYIPARRVDRHLLDYSGTEPTFGTTILQVSHSGDSHKFSRTAPIENAGRLRAAWNRLSPVMKRRFIAIDRTDLAEERTILASYRTKMARARTGLAFTRTGISFVGLGIAMMRQFHPGSWSILDAGLIIFGVTMVSEGFRWNIPEIGAGAKGMDAVNKGEKKVSIWDFMFLPVHRQPDSDEHPLPLSFKKERAPGIWGTTGLALERTLIADRRNVKSRLRTIMSRSRTGMSFIRTGASIFSVGFGLLVYFGVGSIPWTIFNALLLVVGLGGVIDGFYWHIPAKRMQESFSYCLADMEIVLADYGKPSAEWKRVEFSHDDI